MNSLAFRRATGLDTGKTSPLQGNSLVEVVIAMAVVLIGVLAFARSLTQSLEVGEKNRQSALATAAAQAVVEELYAADISRVFALYNEDPSDDPDGDGTGPGATFAAAGLEPRPQDAGKQGKILFPVDQDSPGTLREDLLNLKLQTPIDLDLDGVMDDADHSTDYRLLPVLVRIAWQDGEEERELELATILGAR